jgi:DNA polymerase-3 subunit alpha
LSIDLITPPDRFVSLHSHSTFSTFDGLGYPSDHIDFVLSESQGMDAWGLTDHGNGNGLAHAHSHAVKMQKAGKSFRQVYGVEFYFVPSLEQWTDDYAAHKQAVKDAKTAAAAEKKGKEKIVIDADDESGGLVIEDEDESKKIDILKDEWKRRYHLVITARNRKGLNNLFTLVKKSYKDGFYRYPRVDFKMIKEHGEGLHISTACLGGIYSNRILRGVAHDKSRDEIQKDLQNLSDRFTDAVGIENFKLELQFNKLNKQHVVNDYLIEHHKLTGIPLISTADSHYPSNDKWQARELYKKLGWLGKKDNLTLPAFEDLKCELYPKNAQQMWDEFLDGYKEHDFYKGNEQLVKESIERTHDIVWNDFEDTWIDVSAKLPTITIPDKTPFRHLSDLVKNALVAEGLHTNKEYVDRAKYELSDIKYLGHEAYFITMYEIFKKAETKTLFGPARGSGGGSLVNYLLGITQLDPIPYNLLWSRFLGRHRVSWPDIDTDDGDRDELINAAKELYGDDAVIPVSNFNTLKLKSLIKDIAKFYDIPYDEVNKVTGPLQDQVMQKAMDKNQEKSVFVLKHEDCMKYSPEYNEFMTEYPEVAEHVETLFMQNRAIGRHAGGVIIADADSLAESMPIVGVRGELQTPWTEGMNFRNLEDNGFLKFDFLGLTLLKDVENCIYRILKKQGNDNPTFTDARAFFDKHLNCRFVKQDDPKVWEHVYKDGRFCGIFQFTAPGARNFAKEAEPNSIEELAALTAIYRPGPLKANVHKKYVKAKRNASDIKYDHPIIEKILGPTFNYVVFQEQFMLLAQELSGFDPGEADKLRKTLVKKSLDTLHSKGSEKAIAREKFIKGAKELNDVPESVSSKLWADIENFAVYGFNKSHAVAYAIGSYYAAWLHTHHETEWLAAILQSENGNPKGMSKAISEIKSFGYEIAAVDVNYSGKEWEYSAVLSAFVPPLTSLKGVGDKAVEEVFANRPYKNLEDLFYNAEGEWKHSKLNKTAFSSLTKMEAFKSLQEFQNDELDNHKQMHDLVLDNYNLLKKGRYGMTKTSVKRALKNDEELVPIVEEMMSKYRVVSDWSRTDKIRNYFELSNDASDDLLFPPKLLNKLSEKQISSVFDVPSGDRGIGWFTVTEVIRKTTKNGKAFMRWKCVDSDNRSGWLRVWGTLDDEVEFTTWLADVKNDAGWGMSTNLGKLKKINAFD